MWFRLRPDIGYRDLTFGLMRCLAPGNRSAILADLERLWAGHDHTLVCHSVRTGFDLLWQTLALPPGSEVLMTALTIPDMVTILKRHQLIPVPVDIAPDTLAPDPDEIARCLTPRTRAVVVTHLFGACWPVEPLFDVLASRQILLIEDCAQAFAGTQGYTGHPEADVAMFSFGPIKTATALGGALFRVRDPMLCSRLRELESELRMSSRRAFGSRLLKFLLLKLATSPPIWRVISRVCERRGIAYDVALTRLARGFGGKADLLVKIRQRPATPLLALLRRRLQRFDIAGIHRRQSNGRRLTQLLLPSVRLAGTQVKLSTFWLFPVLSSAPMSIIPQLRGQGFDACRHHTLGVVPASNGALHGSNHQTLCLLEELVFVPAGAAVPDPELDRLASCIRAVSESTA